MAAKSYWQKIYLGSDNAKAAVCSWLSPMSDGMTPYDAEVLCDIATDREKKLRVFMTDKDGTRFQFERTRGGRNFSVSMKPLGKAAA